MWAGGIYCQFFFTLTKVLTWIQDLNLWHRLDFSGLPALLVWFITNLFSHPETRRDTNTPDQTYELANRLLCCTPENQTYTGVESAEQGACVGSTIEYRPATWVSKASGIDSWFLHQSAGDCRSSGGGMSERKKRQKRKKKDAEGEKRRGWKSENGVC